MGEYTILCLLHSLNHKYKVKYLNKLITFVVLNLDLFSHVFVSKWEDTWEQRVLKLQGVNTTATNNACFCH